jgi:activator of HSP90 ATPase
LIKKKILLVISGVRKRKVRSMSETLDLSVWLPAPSGRVYSAWMDSQAHADFTGSPASIDAQVGGAYSAWDGYITGCTLALDPGRRILQSWRTTEFPEDAPDSTLEIDLLPEENGTRLILRQSEIPEGQAGQYRQGWEDFYFKPLLAYYEASTD